MVKYIVEIPAARCIIPWKVAKRDKKHEKKQKEEQSKQKDLEEILPACAEECSKKFCSFIFCMPEVRDGKSRSQKSKKLKSDVRRKSQKSEVR